MSSRSQHRSLWLTPFARTSVACVLGCVLLGCGPPALTRTVPIEAAMTSLAPSLPTPPPLRGAMELGAAVEVQSVLGTESSPPRDLSHYVRPATGELVIGGRFSRYVGARLIGELGLPFERVDGYGHELLGAGTPGRLGGAILLGYSSEASRVSGTLSIEAGLQVVGIQRLVRIESRTCGPDSFVCGPFEFVRFGGTAGIELAPYGRLVGTLGIAVLEWLRVLVQGGVLMSPRLGGTPESATITQDVVVAIEPSIELTFDSVSFVLSGGWTSADVFTYGPRVGLSVRGLVFDGPGSAARTRRAELIETRRRERRERRSRPAPLGVEVPASAYTIDPDDDAP